MKIELAQKENTIEIIVEGDLDLHSSPALRKALLDASNHATKEIRVVLTAVKHMDSSGVATLIEGLRAAKSADKTFALQAPSQPVMKVLELTRLDTIFTLLDGRG